MTQLVRYIRPDEAVAYLALGWAVKPLRGYPGLYAWLAWRDEA